MPSEDAAGVVRCVCIRIAFGVAVESRTRSCVIEQMNTPKFKIQSHQLDPTIVVCLRRVRSGPARKRPRPLEEAVEAGDGVALKFSETFAVDNQNLVLLQVRIEFSLQHAALQQVDRTTSTAVLLYGYLAFHYVCH